MPKPLPWYPDGTPTAARVFAVVGTFAVIATIIIARLAWRDLSYLTWLYWIAACWVIVPPLWFWYEYHFIYCETNCAEFEKFKHGQQTGLAIWGGVAIALGAYVSSDHFKATTPPAAAPQAANQAVTK